MDIYFHLIFVCALCVPLLFAEQSQSQRIITCLFFPANPLMHFIVLTREVLCFRLAGVKSVANRLCNLSHSPCHWLCSGVECISNRAETLLGGVADGIQNPREEAFVVEICVSETDSIHKAEQR